jgi:hypothetical protein
MATSRMTVNLFLSFLVCNLGKAEANQHIGSPLHQLNESPDFQIGAIQIS